MHKWTMPPATLKRLVYAYILRAKTGFYIKCTDGLKIQPYTPDELCKLNQVQIISPSIICIKN